MTVQIFKNTNFGNNDLVWNIPHPAYNFNAHESKTFSNVSIRFPLLTTGIVVDGDYTFDTTFYDYMIIDDGIRRIYYFINSIIAGRNTLIFGVTLDAITTYGILSQPVSGVLVRKHDTNPAETRFDYPTALDFEGNFTNEFYTVLGYSGGVTRLIESTVNLGSINPSMKITTTDGGEIVVPTLPKPTHATLYNVTGWGGTLFPDDSQAFTLYLNDLVPSTVLNTVRGLAGDGAISDSYVIPSEAVTLSTTGAEVRTITGRHIVKSIPLKLEIDFGGKGWTPANEAIKGAFKVAIQSLQEKTKIEFQAWNLKSSVEPGTGHLRFALWCDPKPSGAPYCCPDQVETLYPTTETGIIQIASLEAKSVRGGQWLRSPLIYSTSRGEIFSAIENRLQRERAAYEQRVSLHQLEMAGRERDIQIAQADFQYGIGESTTAIQGAAALLRGDVGDALGNVAGLVEGRINRRFVEELRSLQAYQLSAERQLIGMAHGNNLRNLNVQERIRRVVPSEVVFEPNESLGSFLGYNGFAVSLLIPDIESLKAKDIEYTKYGYPVYESVNNFVMLNHLRRNHTVYQFAANPLVQIGGQVGDMVRTVLQSGIRILTQPYTHANILNNPKL